MLRKSILCAFVLLVLAALPSATWATHFRYGHLTWKRRPDLSPTTAEITLTNAFRRSGYLGSGGDGYAVTGDVISENIGGTYLDFGDGTWLPNSGGYLKYRVTAYDPQSDWLIGVAIDQSNPSELILHEYPSANNGGVPWIASIDSCCRINTLENAAGDDYRVETPIDFSVNGRSPVSSLPPIVSCPANGTCTYVVPAADSDPGTKLSWRLANASEDGGITQPGPPYVVNPLSVGGTTGIVTWDTTGAAVGSLWAVQIVIEDRDASTGLLRGKVAVDHIIIIVASGTPPVIEPPANTPPICASTQSAFVGALLTFTVFASDPTPGDTVTLNSAGIPVGAVITPPLPATGNPVSATFKWKPKTGDVGDYVVNFTATDTAGLQTLCPVTITVRAARGRASAPAMSTAGLLLCAACLAMIGARAAARLRDRSV